MTRVNKTSDSSPALHLNRGFALPTILITSIVMLMVLLVSVSGTTAVRTAMKTQYYQQLAQVAGEAGMAYAEACLAANGGSPTGLWTTAQPLKPNTDCTGTEVVACPTTSVDVRCSVTRNGNVLSTFSVGTVDQDPNGRGVVIPNTGRVELLRKTGGAPWRTYTQDTAQTVTVPDLCSGSAVAANGWDNVLVSSTNDGFPEPLAMQVGLINNESTPGPMFFRKDFSAPSAGTYLLSVRADDGAEISIDGQLITTSNAAVNGGLAGPIANNNDYIFTSSITLAPGCHALTVKLTNANIGSPTNLAKIKLSLKKSGSSTPIVVTDTSWRVSAGDPVHFSSVNYSEDTSDWEPVRDLGAYNGAAWGAGPSPDWAAVSGVGSARWISTMHGYSGGAYPSNLFSVYRDRRVITVAAPTEVRISYACDDNCEIWLDGKRIASTNVSWNVTQTLTMTLTEGSHRFGVVLGNGAGASGFLFGVLRTSDNFTLSRSDKGWTAGEAWYGASDNPSSYSSYDTSYTPNPNPPVICPCPAITNLNPNPSIETDTSGWVGTNASIARSSAWAASGSYSLALTANGAGNDSFATIGGDNVANTMRLGTQAGRTYKMTGTVRVPTALTGVLFPENRELGLMAFWYTNENNFATTQANNLTGTTQVSMIFTIPTTATRSFFRVYHGGLSGTVYWDNVTLVDVTPFVDKSGLSNP